MYCNMLYMLVLICFFHYSDYCGPSYIKNVLLEIIETVHTTLHCSKLKIVHTIFSRIFHFFFEDRKEFGQKYAVYIVFLLYLLPSFFTLFLFFVFLLYLFYSHRFLCIAIHQLAYFFCCLELKLFAVWWLRKPWFNFCVGCTI